MQDSSYTIEETLALGDGTVVSRARRNDDRVPVILRQLDPKRHNQRAFELLRRDYEMGSALDLEGIVRPLALVTYKGMPTLVMEDFGGRPLSAYLGQPMSIPRFLNQTVRIAAAVADIHRHGIVHRCLGPENILVHPATGEVKIADFGLASRLPRELRPARPPELIEGSLPYLSPEQTGRMNRAVDNRSDLYAVGVIFYQMLTGRLPFEARDPLEWIHFHIACVPASPAEIASVPKTVADIVMKLLSKMADDRYQTAWGLLYDLERCAESWRTHGRIEPFTLGERDAADRPRSPQRLYGRTGQLEQLTAAFEHVAFTGLPKLVLVSGYPGTGKSSLVHELHKPMLRRRGIFLSGKFDQYTRNIPYATIAGAFKELVLEALGEDEDHQRESRRRLSRALGPNAQLIVDVVPPLELLIGPQPPVPALPIDDAERRFRRVFLEFVRSFASEAHVLVLFVDDLQWADSASLELMESLLTDPETRYLLLVGAYRETEVTSSHPLVCMLARIRATSVDVEEIDLPPLDLEALTELVADAVRAPAARVEPLARLVFEKTGGNPLFALQFLNTIHEDKLLQLDERSLIWRWDVEGIKRRGYSDNVVDLMVDRLAGLPRATQEVLEIAACAGNNSSRSILSLALGKSDEATSTDLWSAIEEGLIFCSKDGYAFAHDRVQQAAYSRIPEHRRPAMHLSLGRLMLAHTPPEQLGERLFEVVTQLDLGARLVASEDERLRMVHLNLQAAGKAKAAAAHASALGYLVAAHAALPPDAWSKFYELTYRLYLESAQCEWLNGHVDAAAAYVDALLKHARGRVDLSRIYRLKVDMHAAGGEIEEGVSVALTAAATLFGIDLVAHPTEQVVKAAITQTLDAFAGRAIDDLLALPVMSDPEVIEAVALLSASLPCAYFSDPALHHLMCCRIVELSIQHGYSEYSPHGFVIFGSALGHLLSRWDEARRFGDVARHLAETPASGHGPGRSSTYYTIAAFLEFWTAPLGNSADLFQLCLRSAMENFAITNACFAAEKILLCRWMAGDPLEEVERESERRLEFASDLKCNLLLGALAQAHQAIGILRGTFPAADERTHANGAGDRDVLRPPDDTPPHTRLYQCMYAAITSFILGDYSTAARAAAESDQYAYVVSDQPTMAERDFFAALALAAVYDELPPTKREEALRRLLGHQERHRVWEAYCPSTFAHRHALIGAELARVQGRAADAMSAYERAVELARCAGFVHHEAIACERAASFYSSRGLRPAAEGYLRHARSCYARWGADAKVTRLDRLHPWLGERAAAERTTTFTARLEQLDLLSVVKASQTISSELELDTLVRTLLRVALEQSGGQSVWLISNRAGRLWVDAEAAVEPTGAIASEVLADAREASQLLPASVLRYVTATKKRLILDERDAAAGKFAVDAYFARVKPKSALCLPILRQGRVERLLYFENRVVEGAFTPERLAVLQLLAEQSAISMENAQLLSAERASRAAAENAEQRAALLADAGAALSESLDYERTTACLSRLCVRSLAEWCAIDLVEDATIKRVAVAHALAEKVQLVKMLKTRFPPRMESSHPSATALRTGLPLLLTEMSDAAIRAMADSDDHAKLIRELGTRSAISVPMVARDQTLGCITLVSATAGRYTRRDLPFAQELARRVAIAIDNARLYRASQEAVRLREEFLSIASHELYTPMTSLSLSLQALQRTTSGAMDRPRLEKTVAIAARQGERLTRLIDDLLDATRIQRGKLSLCRSRFDLRDLSREVLARFEPNLASARCEASLSGDVPVVGVWDRSRLDQAITNLVSNAIKFGAGHPIEVEVSHRDGFARLAVTDHGVGIDPASQARIFAPFERAATREHHGGLGLGLYIAATIIEAHGGSIRVQSQPGAGATFTIEVPPDA